jgi:hypothetical protein
MNSFGMSVYETAGFGDAQLNTVDSEYRLTWMAPRVRLGELCPSMGLGPLQHSDVIMRYM